MAADGAVGGGGGGGVQKAAVQTHPLHLHIGEEQLVFLHQVSEFAEPVAVGLFHPGDVLKQLAHQGEALAHGGLGEVVVEIGRASCRERV